MHAVQKFVKYSWVNIIFRAQVHSFIHSVVRILRFFLMGRWAINSHFFYGWTVLKVLVLSQLWRCKGFVAVWLFTFFLIDCLLFLLPFHSLLFLCNFSFCVFFFLPHFFFPFTLSRRGSMSCFVLYVRGFFDYAFSQKARLPQIAPSLPGVGPRTATRRGVCVGLPGKVSAL